MSNTPSRADTTGAVRARREGGARAADGSAAARRRKGCKWRASTRGRGGSGPVCRGRYCAGPARKDRRGNGGEGDQARHAHTVNVVGYTDKLGNKRVNAALSLHRAQVVSAALRRQ